MRRHHWLIAGFVLIGLWACTHRSHDGALPTPASVPASAPTALPDASPQPARTAIPPPRGDARYPAFLPRRSARGAGRDRPRRSVRVPPGRRRVPEPRASAAGATAWLLPRVHRGDAGLARPRPAPPRHRRRTRPREYWYSDDHYRSFRRFDVDGRRDERGRPARAARRPEPGRHVLRGRARQRRDGRGRPKRWTTRCCASTWPVASTRRARWS